MKKRGFFSAMKINAMLKDKKGDAGGDTIILEMVIFIVLNLAFFVLMAIFIARAGSGAIVYEQSYAKQIALLIDNAKPGMIILINMEKPFSIADKSGKKRDETVKIDESKNRVIVSLSGQGGYGYDYFSDYKVEIINQDGLKNGYLTIKIGDKNE